MKQRIPSLRFHITKKSNKKWRKTKLKSNWLLCKSNWIVLGKVTDFYANKTFISQTQEHQRFMKETTVLMQPPTSPWLMPICHIVQLDPLRKLIIHSFRNEKNINLYITGYPNKQIKLNWQSYYIIYGNLDSICKLKTALTRLLLITKFNTTGNNHVK